MKNVLSIISNFLRKIVIFPIKVYQYCISPLLPASCRFYPTCSAYAVQAISSHGIFRGCWLTICRLSRCHPWSDGGYDPVPLSKSKYHKGF